MKQFKQRVLKFLKIVGIVLAVVIVVSGGVLFVAARRSVLSDNLNMSSTMGDMPGMNMADMPTPGADATPISKLIAPESDALVKSFTLTAQTAKIDLGGGHAV